LFDCAETLGRVRPPQGKRLAILTNGGGIGVLVVDRLVELGGIPATLSPDVRRQLDAVLPPTWSGANPVDIVGDADAARYAAALEVLLADPDNDAVLVMNVHTAIAPASEIASTVARVVGVDREKRSTPKPFSRCGSAPTRGIDKSFNGPAIPELSDEDDAARGFMHLVQHRRGDDALAEVPPSLQSEVRAGCRHGARDRGDAVSEGRRWLDPIEVKRCSRPI